ncbi:hypothetical protein C2E23DRAFT_838969 [Lenzites betulinus]|nr:hypothetical protein C2E23DRAFT_838969 [Lenzites betulinus]
MESPHCILCSLSFDIWRSPSRKTTSMQNTFELTPRPSLSITHGVPLIVCAAP